VTLPPVVPGGEIPAEPDDASPLGRETLVEVFAHCARSYPEEACGLVRASGRVRCCRNIQDELHAGDPGAFPRQARNGYAFSFPDAVFLDASLTSDDPVSIVFHSHPDVGAYLSDEDVRAALVDGRPSLPVRQLVVSVCGGVVGEARLFAFVDGAFAEVGTFDANGERSVLRSPPTGPLATRRHPDDAGREPEEATCR
jgi:proteasome lid subunit RPN8/RPN11